MSNRHDLELEAWEWIRKRDVSEDVRREHRIHENVLLLPISGVSSTDNYLCKVQFFANYLVFFFLSLSVIIIYQTGKNP